MVMSPITFTVLVTGGHPAQHFPKTLSQRPLSMLSPPPLTFSLGCHLSPSPNFPSEILYRSSGFTDHPGHRAHPVIRGSMQFFYGSVALNAYNLHEGCQWSVKPKCMFKVHLMLGNSWRIRDPKRLNTVLLLLWNGPGVPSLSWLRTGS